MKNKYPPLEGICKKCLYKCNRCEYINFKGVWRCKYYIEEAKDEQNRNTNATT